MIQLNACRRFISHEHKNGTLHPSRLIQWRLLIGLAASLLWITNGRIAGISGIVGNLPSSRMGDIGWRVAFLMGLILAPLAYATVAGVPAIRLDTSIPQIIAGGLLVGFGTRLGSGCAAAMAYVAQLACRGDRSLPPACS